MGDYVSKLVLWHKFKKNSYPVKYDYQFSSLENGMTLTGIAQVLNETPSEKLYLRKTGEWIPQNPMVDTLECSECNYNIPGEEFRTPYCPWCGTKMDMEDVDMVQVQCRYCQHWLGEEIDGFYFSEGCALTGVDVLYDDYCSFWDKKGGDTDETD